MKGIDMRSAAIAMLLTILAAALVSEALGQRPSLSGQAPLGQRLGQQAPAQPGRYQVTGGTSANGRQGCLYVLDQSSGDLYCLDAPQIVGNNLPKWNVSYVGNVEQMVTQGRR